MERIQAQINKGKVEYINIETGARDKKNLAEFLDYLSANKIYAYFHNLDMEAGEITKYLFDNDYAYDSNTTTKRNNKSFNRVEDESGSIISIFIRHCGSLCYIYNSRRKINFKVSDLRDNDDNCSCMDDLEVMAYYMSSFVKEGLERHTTSSDAMAKYKSITFNNNSDFLYYFPKLTVKSDDFIRNAFSGGWCYLNNKYVGKSVKGETYDVNSLYPSVMKNELLPYGLPRHFFGKPQEDKKYPLYIVKVEIDWVSLKEKKFPFITNQTDIRVESEKQYIKIGTNITCYLTNVELDLLKETYNCGNITYIEGFKFKGKKGLFDTYIDYYNEKKMNSTGVNRQIAKLMLNALFGKFGAKVRRSGYKVRIENGIEKREVMDEVVNKGNMIYTAMAVFITSYGRIKTITSANANYKNFIYADTDSIHVKTGMFNKVKGIIVDNKKLGCWKLERKFTKSKFICRKCYAEYDGNWHFTIAGLDTGAITKIEQFFLGSEIDIEVRAKGKNGYFMRKSTYKIGHKLLDAVNMKGAN